MSDDRLVRIGGEEPEEGPDRTEPEGISQKTTDQLAGLMKQEKAANSDEEVKTGTAVKLKAVLKDLKSAKGKETVIAGLKIVDTKKALANLEAFLGHMGKFKFSLEDSYFQPFFSDTVVAESRKSGTYYDPIVLMHPLARFVRTGFHEYNHDNDRNQNEALVDADAEVKAKKCGILDDDSELTAEHEEAKANFYLFIERIDEGKGIDATVEEVFQLYYNERFEKIYELYEESYINKLPEDERDQAFKFFNLVFPELEVKEDGQYHLLVEELGPEIVPSYEKAA